MNLGVKRVDLIREIEKIGLGEVVDQYFCEFVCGRGEFGKCKYLRVIGNVPVCLRRVRKLDNRLLE